MPEKRLKRLSGEKREWQIRLTVSAVMMAVLCMAYMSFLSPVIWEGIHSGTTTGADAGASTGLPVCSVEKKMIFPVTASQSEDADEDSYISEAAVVTYRMDDDGTTLVTEDGTETAAVAYGTIPSVCTYVAEDRGVAVTVTASPGVLPEDAELTVTVFDKDSEEYAAVGDVIGFDVENERDDMVAMDISFCDGEGMAIEPGETVAVSLDMSAILPDDVDAGSIKVQHLVETDEGTEPVLVADAAGDAEGSVDAETAVAEFTVESFSSFTVQWSANTNDSTAIETTCYFSSDNGASYAEDDDLTPVSGTLWLGYDNEIDFDDSNSLVAVSGYTLDSAVLYVPSQNGNNVSYTAVTVESLRATYNWNSGTWTYEYLTEGASDWTTFSVSVTVTETTGGGGPGGGPGSGPGGGTTTTTYYYAYLELYYLESGTETTGDLTITDDISNSGSLVASYSGSEDLSAEGSYYYKWYKLNTDTGKYELIEGEIEQSLAVYIDGARETYRVELVRTSDDTVIATSEAYQVPYYDQLQNGSFEEPSVSGSAQLTNGLYSELVWQTTGYGSGNTNREADGQDIEIVNASAAGSSYGETEAADGDQYAELNCEVSGTLYQDVMTIPGVALYWQASHEARSSSSADDKTFDTMCVIIVDAEFADQYITTQDDIDAVIAASGLTSLSDENGSTSATFTYTVNGESIEITVWLITSDATGWHEYEGTYMVPEGQYVTRFLFGAVSTSTGDLTTGNLLDDVSFSQTPPTSSKSGNITVTKEIEGVGDDVVIPAGTYTFTVTDSSGDALGTVSLPTADATLGQTQYWTYTLLDATPASYSVTEVVDEDAMDGYVYSGTSSYYHYSGSNESSDAKDGTESDKFIVSNEETTTVTFTNTYTPVTVDITLRKADASNNNTVLSGAVFTLVNSSGQYYVYSGGTVTWSDDTAALSPTDDEGTVTILSLPVGAYTLTEVTAPDGYFLLTGSIGFTVNSDETVTFNGEVSGSVAVVSTDADGSITITVKNESTPELPGLGGTGAIWHTMAGLLLAGGAAYLLYEGKYDR